MRTVFLATGLLCLLAVATAHASPWPGSCIQPIAIGQTLSGGELTTADCYWYAGAKPDDHFLTDVYSFAGTAGQQISIALSSTSFDTVVELFNVNEVTANALASDDSGGGATNSRIPAGAGMFTLPATGTYYIWVESAAAGATGAYTLTLNDMASAYARDYVQKAYVGYYGRPADPAGQDYWVTRLIAEGGSLDTMIAAFGTSDEFDRRYGGLGYPALVTKIYLQMLGRDPEQAGLNYYVGELLAGRRTLQSITLDVLNGAVKAPDSVVVANKLDVAAYDTAKVAAGCAYGTEEDAVSALSLVSADPATVTAAKTAIDNRCGLPPPGSCSGNHAIYLGDLKFDGSQVDTEGVSGTTVAYARIVIPNPLPSGWSGRSTYVSIFESGTGTNAKRLYLSKSPCDYSAVYPAYSEGNGSGNIYMRFVDT